MPTITTYPGVYVEEIPSSARTITTVTTSVTAFVGHTKRGPLNTPVRITSFADFEQRFGGLTRRSAVGYAVHQFFANGGRVAVVVRTAQRGSGEAACVKLLSEDEREDCPVLAVHAKEPGVWGNGLHVTVDHDTADPEQTFNLRVSDSRGGAHEVFTGLSLDREHGRCAETVINSGSALIRVEILDEGRPAASGTVSEEFGEEFPDLDVELTACIGDVERDFTLHDPDQDGPAPTTLVELALLLERKLRATPDAPGKRGFADAEVVAFGRRLQIVAGSTDPDDEIRFSGECAGDLGLDETVNAPVFVLEGGADGDPPGPRDLIGDPTAKTGIQALRDMHDVNLLALPELADYESAGDIVSVVSAADRLCRERRIFQLVDAPSAWGGVDAVRAGISAFDPVRSDHAGLYFPHLQLPDPLTGRLRSFPPCGAVAGVIARTDGERGVWKAPAGTEAKVFGVRSLSVQLSDRENGLLNPLGVNCLRTFPVVGPLVWGSRTLAGAESADSEWKYLPVRRLALHVEESLRRGLQWAVFEPNNDQLWQQIRLNASGFLHGLFQHGAFQGRTPREAYFVKCDSDTTGEADVERGVVNVVVGIAPVKPAEFVVVTIQQMTGQPEV
ncbi:phage tail sheath family protein [Saccharopolyspora aridisoli]|uniref:Phage tail sheath family protein n=1 Tax=Saccharopolyspora aridisoli TaxID=2530385 RepID=A0A4R4UKD6_9PSEU|nr:phage tail sheath C-terminal domain-containing protein [Saccharopolyspora aridisoli]TDC89524.1 phage tail sheath family protein [Saccharopolyspora aridisoli]